ncbi:MAG: NAD(P)/FAD-dependent oxidoreductase [Actinobacteria bacterium]|nr:NAD(P)/FAD-dependent oxidoreductase [Actinomycetota bacterium]
MAHILILGGGFGGLAAASELRGQLDERDEITLIARDDRFYMGFAKLWDLADMRPLEGGSAPLADLERAGVRFVRTEVTGIDPVGLRVNTADGTLTGDGLVVALGAVPSSSHRDLLRGDSAHDLYDAAQLPAMKRDLDAIEEGRVLVAILGGPFKCPPAPYEAALLVDERLRRRGARHRVALTVATPQPITLPAAGPDASRYVADHLGERDIELRAEHAVEAVDADRRTVVFRNGAELDYAVLLGVPASAPPPVVTGSPLAGPSGWVEPDRGTLRTGYERVYAVGDCTMVPTAGGQLPKAGVFAAAQAQVAARNLLADLGRGEAATYEGHGYCFLELPGRRVAYVEGDFYADPPDVQLIPADEEQFRRKQAFERERLAAWLGATASW